ncbi:hypothetical protein HEP85_06570 [Streptomyces sp. RPA4-2]|uniref:hypothetical protein n=1 Tax=Streptomyces sp. RPA4-2 TaxID=2721244 RepID=UPI00143E1F0D|nr:hypothetical protein [Streptomyces sp. RPA4-2]QIY60365.1 hypothetical protein HEP85_06570 [Streptomyces sp. RPA4-2]
MCQPVARSPAPAGPPPQPTARPSRSAYCRGRAPGSADTGRRVRTVAGEPLVALLIDAAIAHTKADLGLLDSAERHLSPLAAAQGVGPGR